MKGEHGDPRLGVLSKNNVAEGDERARLRVVEEAQLRHLLDSVEDERARRSSQCSTCSRQS